MDFGMRLKKLRIQKELTQQELAQTLGYTYQYISALERNINVEKIEVLQKLCRLFDVTADYLINGVPFGSIEEVSIEEMQLILKYRSLSEYYKTIVDQIIDNAEK